MLMLHTEHTEVLEYPNYSINENGGSKASILLQLHITQYPNDNY